MRLIRRLFPQVPVAQLAPNPVNQSAGVAGGAPVLFSAQALALAPGVVAPLNAQTLQSGFRTPYFIDEIRVSVISSQYKVFATANFFTGLSGLIKLKFDTGKHAFSKNAVPIGLMAPLFSRYDYGEAYAGQFGADPAAGDRAFVNIRWLLPKPLFMPAGDVVQAFVEFDSNTPASTIGITADVTVSYVGRLLAPTLQMPAKRQIPWLSYMQQTVAAGAVGGASFAQSALAFENPFMDNLYVQRFTARTFKQTVSGGALGDTFAEVVSEAQHYTTATPYFETRIDDSMGYQIVPEFTPVGDVFDSSRHAWTFSRFLAARQQFNVQLRTGLDGAAVPTDTQYVQQIGFVGYREELT